jgi:hypothetical protein
LTEPILIIPAMSTSTLPKSQRYFRISFFNRSITSGGWDITSLANASTSSPLLGSISSFDLPEQEI